MSAFKFLCLQLITTHFKFFITYRKHTYTPENKRVFGLSMGAHPHPKTRHPKTRKNRITQPETRPENPILSGIKIILNYLFICLNNHELTQVE